MPDTAVIVLDLQQAFFAANGSLARRGERIGDASAVLEAVDALVALAHERDVPVVFTRTVFEADADTPMRRRLRAQGREGEYLPGSPEVELVPLRARSPRDQVIDKGTYDAFARTGLEQLLARAGVRRLIISGVLTEVCVESCARSAFERGFDVVVVEDATGSCSAEAKSASLAVIRRSFGDVAGVRELERRLAGNG